MNLFVDAQYAMKRQNILAIFFSAEATSNRTNQENSPSIYDVDGESDDEELENSNINLNEDDMKNISAKSSDIDNISNSELYLNESSSAPTESSGQILEIEKPVEDIMESNYAGDKEAEDEKAHVSFGGITQVGLFKKLTPNTKKYFFVHDNIKA